MLLAHLANGAFECHLLLAHLVNGALECHLLLAHLQVNGAFEFHLLLAHLDSEWRFRVPPAARSFSRLTCTSVEK